MRILSMTATFGKLNHQTLKLKPGLNIIQAPNEWGKSTWCAFLAAMLYGIDTSQRTTQAQLADKEHYAPWSGLPMSGRLEILWRGKEITIERSTKGRIPMGEFSAYETGSGLPVPELTADNCGQTLLGVERSVFLRAGFIRQSEMPVTQDDALRRRLNALVTTGDENDAGDRLAKQLKDLKNRCRHNKTGALPQAEAQQAQLTEALSRLTSLRTQLEQLQSRQNSIRQQLELLQNHQKAMAYDRAKEGLYRLELARNARISADQQVRQLQAQTAELPDAETLTHQLQQLQQLSAEKASLESQPLPGALISHEIFGDLTPDAALAQARNHKASWDAAQAPGPLLPILAGISLSAGIGLSFLWPFSWLPALGLSAILLAVYIRNHRKNTRVRKILSDAYGSLPPANWIAAAEAYGQSKSVYQSRQHQLAQVTQQLTALTGSLSPDAAAEQWQSSLELYRKLEQANDAARQAALREADLEASVRPAEPAPLPDSLMLSDEETAGEIARLTASLQQLQLQSGQCIGQIEALGQESVLRQQLETTRQRIQKLTAIYEATVLALAHLEQAALQLQQRFAPQLTAKARELFAVLTDGRYDRLLLDQQLQLQAAAAQENSLHTARWRSDGTIDQLYLALRLAVADQLTPQAPLILDDVLVRFDDTRHTAAMKLLGQQASQKQILLFTCQLREGTYSPESIIDI